MSVPSDFEEALSTLLINDDGVVSLVSDRVYPNRVPQREQLPAVITKRVSGGPQRTLNGIAGTKRGVFQIESWSGKSQEEARGIDLLVQAAIENFGRGRLAGWFVQALLVDEDSDSDNPQIPTHADDLGFFCSVCSITVFYEG